MPINKHEVSPIMLRKYLQQNKHVKGKMQEGTFDKENSKGYFQLFPRPTPPGSNSETILLGNPNGLSRRLNQEGYGSRAAEVKVKGQL